MIHSMANLVESAASVASSEYESAYGTSNLPYSSPDSESSGKTRQRLEKKHRKKKEGKSTKKEKEKKKNNNRKRPDYKGPGVKTSTQHGDCPYCVLHGRTSKHPW